MPRKIDPDVKGALRRNTHEEFMDVMTGKTKTVGQWEDEQKAYRAARSSSVGNYDSKSGQRVYGPRFVGREKGPYGR